MGIVGLLYVQLQLALSEKEVLMNDKTDKWNDIVARYYGDSEFADKLETSPSATLKAEGLELPEGVEIKLHKNSSSEFHLVLPPDPTSELSEGSLKNVTAGWCCACGSGGGWCCH